MDAQETFTTRAAAVARETGWDVDGFASDHDWTAVGIGPVGQHRDSEALDRSNYRVILADLQERFGDAVAEASFGHWGVGWVDEIAFDASREDVCEAVARWESALADYPVADESDYSELEQEELVAYCRTLPAYVERDGIEYESPNYMSADTHAEELASVAFDALQASRAEDVREDALIDAAIAAGLYVPEPDSLAETLAELRRERDALADLIADHARELVTDAELHARAHAFA